MEIRRLASDDAAAYRALSLQAYAADPDAFRATVAEREPLPLAWWADRLGDGPDPDERVLGAFEAGGLVGVVGLRRCRRPRMDHRAWLFGMAVAVDARGQGVGRALVEGLVGEARATAGVRVVRLTVMASNDGARRLYAACGFDELGTEPLAVRVGARFEPQVHMWREVGA